MSGNDGSDARARLKILVVDDERLIRFMMSSILRSAGYEVVEASSATEAVGKLTSESFCAVVTDVLMGDVDGFMLRDAIRERNKAIPVVFLTSLVNENDGLMKRVMEDFRSYYLSKNATRETILQCVAYVTNAYQIEQDAQRQKVRLEKDMALASLVQRTVLPAWVHVEKGYRYGDFWRPFGKISGDLVEWVPLTPDSCLFVFGDISGHGTHSALAMMAVQVFLKQLTNELNGRRPHPHRVLTELNTFFSSNLANVTYMSCLVAYWDFAKNELVYCNAGHNDIACYRTSTGERIDLNPQKKGGVPVGLLPGTTYTTDDVVRVTFPDDAMFVVYSDGITDLTNDAKGDHFLPEELADQVLSVLAMECGVERDVTEIPTEFYLALKNLGYSYRRDDILAFAIAKTCDRDTVFAQDVRTDATGVEAVAQAAFAWVRDRFGSEDLAFRVELLLEEHLMNVSSHGVDAAMRHGEHAMVIIRKDGDRPQLMVRVLDPGKPWNFAENVKGRDLEAHCDAQNASYAAHGRGMAIKKKLVSEARYRRLPGMNRNIFYVPFDEAAAAAPAEGKEAEAHG